jgi:hypothetical protein
MAAESTMLSRQSAALLLLAGWNGPELSADKIGRWSSLRSQIGIREGVEAIRLAGWSPPSRRIGLHHGSQRLVELEVDGPFSLEAALPAYAVLIELVVDQALKAPEDRRELGVRLGAVSWLADGLWQDVDLSAGFEGLVRFKHQATTTTLGQFQRREVHDTDFHCFANWKGRPDRDDPGCRRQSGTIARVAAFSHSRRHDPLLRGQSALRGRSREGSASRLDPIALSTLSVWEKKTAG